MVNSTPGRWTRPSDASWLAAFFARHRRHPEEIECGVRVVRGALDGEGAALRYRRSHLDALILDGSQEFTHGTVRMRLRADVTVGRAAGAGSGARPGHILWQAELADGSATVELAADPDVAARFGVA